MHFWVTQFKCNIKPRRASTKNKHQRMNTFSIISYFNFDNIYQNSNQNYDTLNLNKESNFLFLLQMNLMFALQFKKWKCTMYIKIVATECSMSVVQRLPSLRMEIKNLCKLNTTKKNTLLFL